MRKNLVCILLGLILLIACRKRVPEGKLEEGQVAITFDDASIDNWHQYLPFLDSLGIKATFYISSYHTLDNNQKRKLKDIEMRGHEIGYHTSNHADLPKEVDRKGLTHLIEKEIKTDLRLMRNDGYRICNFAYPYGSHTKLLDSTLLRYFKSVRALSNKQDYYKSLVKESGEGKVLYGANIDNNSRLKEDKIISLMNDAQAHHDCLILVAHQINNPTIKLQITKERLRLIAKNAQEKNLRFITVSEIVF